MVVSGVDVHVHGGVVAAAVSQQPVVVVCSVVAVARGQRGAGHHAHRHAGADAQTAAYWPVFFHDHSLGRRYGSRCLLHHDGDRGRCRRLLDVSRVVGRLHLRWGWHGLVVARWRRLVVALGWHGARRVTHVGGWGTHFGICCTGDLNEVEVSVG